MSNPTTLHWQACKRVLRYIKDTMDTGPFITPSSTTQLLSYKDTDWAGSSEDRRLTDGFAVYLGKNLISWSAKK